MVLGTGPYSSQIERAIRALLSGGTSGSTVFTGSVAATRFLAGDGTVAAPSVAFASDAAVPTGWYRRDANEWNWSYGGVERYRIGVNFEFGGTVNLGNVPLGFSTSIGATPDVYQRRLAAGTLRMAGNSGETTGVTLRWATDGLLEVRNFANSAPARVSASALQLPNSGAAPTVGNATLVGGTVTVSTTAIGASDVVLVTRKTSGGTIGTAITYTISAGVSFTITSDSALDTSTLSWTIVKAG